MLQDISTVVWKEAREFMRIGGGKRGAVFRLLLSVGLLGVLWPWLLGMEFITSALPAVFSAMTAAMYVSALVPDTFPGERERHTLETLLATRLPDGAILFGKIGAVMLYGMGTSMFMLLVGWATVNLKLRAGLLFYEMRIVLAAIVFTLLAAGFMAAIGTVVALRSATVKQAQQVLTTGIMILFIMPAILAEAWPRAFAWLVSQLSGRDARTTFAIAVTMLIVQVVLFVTARRMFKRSRLLIERAN